MYIWVQYTLMQLSSEVVAVDLRLEPFQLIHLLRLYTVIHIYMHTVINAHNNTIYVYYFIVSILLHTDTAHIHLHTHMRIYIY